MQLISRTIIATGIALGAVSMLYFFSLVLVLPFVIAASLIVVATSMFVWWFLRKPRGADEQIYLGRMPLYILLTGLLIMVAKSQSLGLKYGGWDAWTIWNYHAKFMVSGKYWINLFSGTIDHPDYPLLIPGVNGFFLRLFSGHGETMVPFVISFSIALFIPVLIYMEARTDGIIAAAIIYLLIASDTYFLQNALTQYADVPLAFFFLSAMVCISYARDDKRNVAIAAACIGCCVWTKNEGVVLAMIFAVFNLQLFFSVKNIIYTLAGFGVPFVALVVFKHFYAPSNDILSTQGLDTWHQLFVLERYRLVWKHFAQELDQNFYYAKVGFALYLLVCLVKKKWPDKEFIMVISCLLAYLMIYILSTKDLEWHLATSLGRLLLQLMPAMMYVIALKFSGGKISFVTQKSH